MKRLSLLSRGKCEVGQSSSGQFPVTLEPHDFHPPDGGLNYTGVRSFGDSSIHTPSGVHQYTLPRMRREAILPKTYLTKKGALFLYSEDFARFHREIVPQEGENNFRSRQMNISTADLTLAISRYEQSHHNTYSRFLRDHGDVKPGHSARRHVVAWHLAHPELAALGSRFTKHDIRSRRTRAARTSLNVVPTPYNLPKSLNQIRKGLRSQEGSPERDKHHHVEWATHSMWSPGIQPNKSKLRMPPIQHLRTAQPVMKAHALRKWTRPPSPRPLAPEVDNVSSLSSEAKFTRAHLPSIYKNPSSQLHKLNGVNSPDATNVVRKKVRIQLDPVIFPNTDSPELDRIF